MPSKLGERISAAAEAVRARTPVVPEFGIILGTGLGEIATQVEDAVAVPYAEVPGLPSSELAGHAENV